MVIESLNIKKESKPAQARMAYAAPPPDFDLDRARRDIGEWDRSIFQDLTQIELTPEQVKRIVHPEQTFPKQKSMLALHWHPEWIPLEYIRKRIDRMFPNRESDLIIPTQHNEIMVWDDYAGVEVDCYAAGFNRKVQLLLHCKADRLQRAYVLKSMLNHTFKYRSGQMFEYIDTIVNPDFEDRLQTAAAETGANEEVVNLTRFYTARLKKLLDEHETSMPKAMIKNRLVPDFLDAQRERHPDLLINRALLFVKAVKRIVKQFFSLDYFFNANEIIEEARYLHAGIVIPHPEQFWPILLADYDVDGWEVWNPQSREYTEFLIGALGRQNKLRRPDRQALLVFMGDDAHMSSKLSDPTPLGMEKYEREIGLQPAWDDLAICKSLSLAGAKRSGIISEYKARLGA